MPLRVNRIAAVGVAAPHLVSEVFVMGSFGPPAGVTKGECLMGTENFLQKNHVGTYGAHGLSKLRQNEFSVKKVKSLMGINRQYSNRKGFVNHKHICRHHYLNSASQLRALRH